MTSRVSQQGGEKPSVLKLGKVVATKRSDGRQLKGHIFSHPSKLPTGSHHTTHQLSNAMHYFMKDHSK